MELVCGWITATEIEQEIPFLCDITSESPPEEIGVMYGMGCKVDNQWEETRIPAARLREWIDDSIERGIYTPGDCDIFISQGERLKVHLCHESDIHIETVDPKIIEECTSRWLEKGYRVHRKRLSAGMGWKDVWSVEDVLSALSASD